MVSANFHNSIDTEETQKSKFKDAIEKEIRELYEDNKVSEKKRKHKRIASMQQPQFEVHKLAVAPKGLRSDADDQTDGFTVKSRHSKCKHEEHESPSHKKHLSKAEFDSMVDRLYTCYKIYADRLERRKYKAEEEALETNTFKP